MGKPVLNGITGPLEGLVSHDPVFSVDSRICEDLPEDGSFKPFWAILADIKDCYLEPLTAEELQLALERLERDGKVRRQGEACGPSHWSRA